MLSPLVCKLPKATWCSNTCRTKWARQEGWREGGEGRAREGRRGKGRGAEGRRGDGRGGEVRRGEGRDRGRKGSKRQRK